MSTDLIAILVVPTCFVLAGLLIAFVGVARLGESRDATIMLIGLGPLIPLIGARVAFGRRIDPAGMMAPAATATKPAISAYSMRSWPLSSFHLTRTGKEMACRSPWRRSWPG